jgi:hypothetical protein
MSNASDNLDLASERTQQAVDAAVAQVQNRAAAIPQGEPGDCELCGGWSARLVCGACAPCRDRYKL